MARQNDAQRRLGVLLRYAQPQSCGILNAEAVLPAPLGRLRSPGGNSGEEQHTREVTRSAHADHQMDVGAQIARTSASRLTAYSSSQQTAASHAAEACAAMSCAPSSRPAALWGSARARAGTSTCASSQSISATRFAVMRTFPGLLGLPWTTHVSRPARRAHAARHRATPSRG